MVLSVRTVLVHSADSPSASTSVMKPAKARGIALPQEYQLVRMFENVKDLPSTWNIDTPACEWEGILCIEKRASFFHLTGNVRFLDGHPQWEYLPSSVTCLHLPENRLCGEINTSSLPNALTELNVRNNVKLSGEVNLGTLPSALTLFLISCNSFSGELDFGNLPATIKQLWMQNNKFSHAIGLRSLPVSLRVLYLHDNPELVGEINVTLLPEFLALKTWTNTQIRVL